MQYRPTKTRSKRTLAIATAVIVGLSGLALNVATATTSNAETVEQCVQRRIDNRSGGAFLNTSTSFRTECQKEIAAKQQEVKNRPPADFNNTFVDAGELQEGKTRTPAKTPPPPGNNNSGNTGGAKTPAPPAQTPPAAAPPAQTPPAAAPAAQTPPAAAPAKPAPAPDPAAAAKAKLQQTLTQEQAQLDAACKKAQVANITEANWNAAKKEYDAAYAATTKTRADNNLPKPNGYCQQLVKFTGATSSNTANNTTSQQTTTGGAASTGTSTSTATPTGTATSTGTGTTSTAGSSETSTAVREKALKDLATQQTILNDACQKAQAANITLDDWSKLKKQYEDAYAAATKVMADGNLGTPKGYCQFLIRFENGKVVDTTKAGHNTKIATARLDAAKNEAIASRDTGKTAPVTELNRNGTTAAGSGANTNTNTASNTNTNTVEATKTDDKAKSTGTITGNNTNTTGGVASAPSDATATHKVEGTQVVVTGTGFVPGTQVKVTVKDSNGTVINVSIATVASDKTVKATSPAPAGATAQSLKVDLDVVK